MPVTDFSKTIIYKIVCNDLTIKDCYIGHTINMTKRKCVHKSRCHNEKAKHYNTKIYKIIRQNGGWSNWSMILVEKFPCKNKHEACKREREIFEEIDAKMNMVRLYRTQEELKEYKKQNQKKYYHEKQYYQDHKEQIKLYQEANKEEIAEKKKQYYQDHKEQIKLYYQDHKEETNKKIECEFCSKLISKQNMTRHLKICKCKE